MTVRAAEHGLVALAAVDGRLARADADHETDLFWAARGGGGSVGVVTALEMTLFPVRELYAGVLFFPVEQSSELLHAWRAWTDTVPDELTSIVRVLQVPPFPEIPEPTRGRAFALVEAIYIGVAVAVAGAEPARWRGSLPAPEPKRRSTRGSSCSPAVWSDARAARGRPRTLASRDGRLSQWRADYDYYNFAETPAEADCRLREVKARYDPDEVVISAHPVRPAGD